MWHGLRGSVLGVIDTQAQQETEKRHRTAHAQGATAWSPLGMPPSLPYPRGLLGLSQPSPANTAQDAVFLADTLGTDPYCSSIFGWAAWHVANAMDTPTKNARFLAARVHV